MHAACLTTYHVNILLEGELFRTLRASPETQDELAAHITSRRPGQERVSNTSIRTTNKSLLVQDYSYLDLKKNSGRNM
jgi:hypothetical protein